MDDKDQQKSPVEVGTQETTPVVASTPPPESTADETPKLSKNQMKKLQKHQRYLEKMKVKRKIDKERKKQKKALIRQSLENNQQVELPIVKRHTLMANSSNKFRIVIDMDFEEYMTDLEMGKAAKQVGRIYSLNRHSKNPFQLYITSLKGKVRDKFAHTNRGYESWDVNISQQDYVELFGLASDSKDTDSRANVIYLTGDSQDALPDGQTLLGDETMIFVIGGLVDHNRHKNLCFNRAQDRNIRTAQLPIKDNIKLCQRHVLSTVTVFEILLKVIADKMTWKEALLEAIPKRKQLNTSNDNKEAE